MEFFKKVKSFLKSEKGQGGLDSLALSLVVTGAIVGVGLVIMVQMNTSIYQVIATTIAGPGAAINNVIGAIDDIPGWLSVVVVVFIGGLVINYLGGFRRNAGRGT